jgi:hypothetical protein
MAFREAIARRLRLFIFLAALPGILGLARLALRNPGDMRLYYEYANLVLGRPAQKEWVAWFPQKNRPEPHETTVLSRHQVPYLDFACEYPPMALAVMALPRLVSHDLKSYGLAYHAMSAVAATVALLLLLLLARGTEDPPRDCFLVAAGWSGAVLANGSMITTRFDIYAALFALLAVRQLQLRRLGLAGGALGVGAAIKLWPIVGVAMAAVYRRDLRESARLVAVTIAVFLLPHVALFVFWGSRSWSYLTYHAVRGIHFESFIGNLLMIVSKLSGSTLSVKLSYGAYHLVLERGTAQIASWSWLLAMLPLVYLLLRSVVRWPPSPPGDAWRASALLLATLTALVVVSAKVLSGEYLIWLAFLFLVPTDKRWPARAALLIVAGFLTKHFYRSYDRALVGDFGPNILLTVRNLMLLASLALGLRSAADRAAQGPEVPAPLGRPPGGLRPYPGG